MSLHRCPALALNSSLLVIVIVLTGCQSQVISFEADEQEPTWSFKNITWRTADSGKKLLLRAEVLDHFGDEIRAENLSFSYQTPEQSISGSAASSTSSPQLQSIEFSDITMTSEDFGSIEAASGNLDAQASKLFLQRVDATLEEPRLKLATDSAVLTLSTDKTVMLETSAMKGSLRESEEP